MKTVLNWLKGNATNGDMLWAIMFAIAMACVIILTYGRHH